jgi:NAD(P)-dependent dehydrogenase (short-subunit alcohol dehydrogenase family)
MADAFRLEGKTVVLTGAAGVIGTQVALAFVEAGARVCAIDRNAALLKQKLGPEHAALLHCPADVSDRDALLRARKKLEGKWGTADALINNAIARSLNYFEPFETLDPAEWNEVLAVNLTGAMLACQVFGGPMAGRGQGSIVNTLSIYAMVGPDQRIYEGSQHLGKPVSSPAVYGASKAGLWGLTRYLAAYWGGQGVRVNAVSAGAVASEQGEEFVRRYTAQVPLGRLAEAADVAAAMRYLVSDASKHVTGHNLVVDGGRTAW